MKELKLGRIKLFMLVDPQNRMPQEGISAYGDNGQAKERDKIYQQEERLYEISIRIWQNQENEVI